MKALDARNQVSRTGGFILLVFGAAVGIVIATSPASAQTPTLNTLVSFNGDNGQNPEYGNLLSDANGNLYGTTSQGGNLGLGYGEVFEITNNSGTYSGTAIPLVTFDGTEGMQPLGGLIADTSGNLYGTTSQSSEGYGTVFEVPISGTNTYLSTPTTLLTFTGSDNGSAPNDSLIVDSSNNLFGTASGGGSLGGGTAFELTNTGVGTYAAPTSSLSEFGSGTGSQPIGGLIADSNGNLFGTTRTGGDYSSGTVFELVKTTGGYTRNTLVSFDGSTGGKYPYAGLIADSNGNLFGTTYMGGSGFGTVFEIPYTSGSYANTPTILASFDGTTHGKYPKGGLIQDANGSLFGTTSAGGANGLGNVFEITKTSGVFASTPTILINFDGTNGAGPLAGLIADSNGNLFGTTYFGGDLYDPANYTYGDGTVFELSGSGFVPPRQFAGVPGTANCAGVSISRAMRTYGGMAHAATALGYANAAALQSAVAQYCGN